MKLPRLRSSIPMVGKEFRPTDATVRFWETFAAAVEAQDAAQQATLDALQAQVDRLTVSLRAISHADGLFLTSEANGATAKVTITTHTRNYLDVAVSVTGATLTGLLYATTYSVYYDDAARAGGAVSYVATLIPANAVTSAANPNRQLVGAVTTPATSGSPPTDGGGSTPPGYPPAYDYETP